MAMDQLQRHRVQRNAKTVFRVSMTMVVLIVIMMVSYSCINTDNQLLKEAKDIDFIQYTVPEDSAKVVVFETTYGTIKAVLFEDKAPNFCEYFEKLVNDGYYNDTYFFNVEDEQHAYAFGGSKAADGTDTDDTDKEMLEPEKSYDLWPFRGAMCTYGREKGVFNKRNTTGSRLLFINSIDFTDDVVSELKDLDADEALVDYFLDRGGVPNFAQQFTIFAQVYEGIDVIEKIASTEVDENNKPTSEIKIISAKMSTYGENKSENEQDAFPESFKQEEQTSETDDSLVQ